MDFEKFWLIATVVLVSAILFSFGLLAGSEGMFGVPAAQAPDCNCVICRDCPALPSSPSGEFWLKLFLLSRFKEYDANKFESMAFGASDGRFWWQSFNGNFYGVLCVSGKDVNAGRICCEGGQLDANRSRVIVPDWSVQCYG